MDKKSMTTIELKKINKNKVYKYIYHNKTTCKLIISSELKMGLSTVNHNLKELESEGLVRKNGFFNSTGGRKADAIEIVENVKISIGIAILKNQFHIVASNLNAKIICSETFTKEYLPNNIYYEHISKELYSFIKTNNIEEAQILGVSIATQGIISKDGKSVSYGKILNNNSMNIDDFQQYIPYKCRLEHDSKAAANLALYTNPKINDGVVILLNNNLGGAIFTNKEIIHGLNMRSGVIEHIHVADNDKTCYCGKKGCLETICSINSLEENANLKVEDFFIELPHNEKLKKIWINYLETLSLAISNLSLVVDGHIILSGYLSSYITEQDINFIATKVKELSPFEFSSSNIILSDTGLYTQALGTSLYYLKEFIDNI